MTTTTAALVYSLPNDLSEYGFDLVARDGDEAFDYEWHVVDVPDRDVDEHGVWVPDADVVVEARGLRAVTEWHREDTPAGIALVADVEVVA